MGFRWAVVIVKTCSTPIKPLQHGTGQTQGPIAPLPSLASTALAPNTPLPSPRGQTSPPSHSPLWLPGLETKPTLGQEHGHILARVWVPPFTHPKMRLLLSPPHRVLGRSNEVTCDMHENRGWHERKCQSRSLSISPDLCLSSAVPLPAIPLVFPDPAPP